MDEQILVIGAGISGCTLARKIAEAGKKVVIVDIRTHIGGNCYDYFDKDGNYVKPYGPHIFHTKHEEVYNFLSRFTSWNSYKHKVYAEVDDKLYIIPFNVGSIRQAFDDITAKRIVSRLEYFYGKDENVSILKLMQKKDDYYISLLSEFVYRKIFLNYTLKQWDIRPENISPEVIDRVPVYIGKEEQYFKDDRYQGMPKYGFTSMFNNMINHENIKLILNEDYKNLQLFHYRKIFVTSPIDEFFDYKYGKLKYRRLRIELETINKPSYQYNSVINFPQDKSITRISEFNKFLRIKNNSTVIGREYPTWDKDGFLAYPVLDKKNLDILEKYKKDIEILKNVYFVGRLAEYKYLNMDQVVKNALSVAEGIQW